MRTSARAVVIGGGVGGCSILYWLARLGWSDVVLCVRRDVVRQDRVVGPGAARFLEGLCANRVARDVGAVAYTQMLNPARRDRMRLHGDPARR